MVLRIPISEDTEARLRERARAAGKDVTQFVADLVERAAGTTAPAANGKLSADEFDAVLDEFFRENPEPVPALPADFSRADVYVDHD